MKRVLLPTKDGSFTVQIEGTDTTYHSRHGAIGESMHVFIQEGLRQFDGQEKIHVLEMGFGTGLNALLTLAHATGNIEYEALEAFPLEEIKAEQLGYPELMNRPELQNIFQRMHECPWKEPVSLTESFTLTKHPVSLEDFRAERDFHLIYYDAFAPSAQPELWTSEIFAKLYDCTEAGGILVTYCSKSIVRKAMKEAGWNVTKPQGPHGKREMVRAYKNG